MLILAAHSTMNTMKRDRTDTSWKQNSSTKKRQPVHKRGARANEPKNKEQIVLIQHQLLKWFWPVSRPPTVKS
jgi:hypothetical protein